MGNPSLENPQVIDIAGNPLKLNGLVNVGRDVHKYPVVPSRGMSSEPILNAGTGVVGPTSKSRFSIS